MIRQVNKFSLEEIMCPNNIVNKEGIKKEEQISEEVKDFLSNVSKTIGIVNWERKVTSMKENSNISLFVLNSV